MSFVPPQARARTFIAILALATIAQAKLGKVPGLMDSAEDQAFKQVFATKPCSPGSCEGGRPGNP